MRIRAHVPRVPAVLPESPWARPETLLNMRLLPYDRISGKDEGGTDEKGTDKENASWARRNAYRIALISMLNAAF